LKINKDAQLEINNRWALDRYLLSVQSIQLFPSVASGCVDPCCTTKYKNGVDTIFYKILFQNDLNAFRRDFVNRQIYTAGIISNSKESILERNRTQNGISHLSEVSIIE
jgi:hypothetical protein